MMLNPEFDALEPFYTAIRRMLGDRIDDDTFFDMLAEDAVWEYGLIFAGTKTLSYPAVFFRLSQDIVAGKIGRKIVYQTSDGVILEYHSHGRGTQTGRPYDNQYISVLTIRNRAIVHWRDYSNKLAVLDAVGDIGKVSEAMRSQA